MARDSRRDTTRLCRDTTEMPGQLCGAIVPRFSDSELPDCGQTDPHGGNYQWCRRTMTQRRDEQSWCNLQHRKIKKIQIFKKFEKMYFSVYGKIY